MIAQAGESVQPMRGTLRGSRNAKVSPTRITHLLKLLSVSSPSRTAGSASFIAIRSAQDISRLHWRYFASRAKKPQQKIDARL